MFVYTMQPVVQPVVQPTACVNGVLHGHADAPTGRKAFVASERLKSVVKHRIFFGGIV